MINNIFLDDPMILSFRSIEPGFHCLKINTFSKTKINKILIWNWICNIFLFLFFFYYPLWWPKICKHFFFVLESRNFWFRPIRMDGELCFHCCLHGRKKTHRRNENSKERQVGNDRTALSLELQLTGGAKGATVGAF